jgi:predicted transposase YdaD
MRDHYDRSSKWLLTRHGNSLLWLGQITAIRSWRAVQADVVQPRRLPDGLLEVVLADRSEPDLFLIELSTYPERRVNVQMLRDAMLVYLDRNGMPELLTLVLQPRGNVRLTGTHTVESRLGLLRMQIAWRVIEVWTLSAEELLAANDVGLVPWVPLTQFDGPPEALLQRCRERIDQQAPPEEHDNLLAVTQVLGRLRYNTNLLMSIFGGSRVMIESPLIQELVGQARQKDILRALKNRFGADLAEIVVALQPVLDEDKLDELFDWAMQCPDLASFRARLTS